MSAIRVIEWHSWELAQESDRAFYRWLGGIAVPVLAFMLALSFLDLVGPTRGGGTLTGQRFVELVQDDAPIAEQAEEASPAETNDPDPVEPEATAEAQPETPAETPPQRPQPTAAPVPRPTVDPAVAQAQAAARASAEARARAQEQARVFDQLSSLRSERLTGIDPGQPLTTSGAVVGTTGGSSSGAGSAANPNRIAESAAASGGITTPGTGDVRRTQQGTGLGTRTTSQVNSPVGFGEDRSRPGQGGDKLIPGRTINEVQQVFDRNKGAFTAIMNRALRNNPDLRGKIVVSFTIQADGSVRDLVLVSSELGDPEVERQLLTRIGLINFGAKSVPSYPVTNYPIVLL